MEAHTSQLKRMFRLHNDVRALFHVMSTKYAMISDLGKVNDNGDIDWTPLAANAPIESYVPQGRGGGRASVPSVRIKPADDAVKALEFRRRIAKLDERCDLDADRQASEHAL